MANKIVHLGQPSRQGIRDTLVTVKDLKTGKILDQGSNSILYAGSINAALKDFSFYQQEYNKPVYSSGNGYVSASGIAIPPNYDISLLGKAKYDDDTANTLSADGVVCLFAVGIDGVENSVQSSQRKEVKYEGYMDPADMCAFRVVPVGEDLPASQKSMYAAQKRIGDSIFYYFKKFASMPIMYTQRDKSGQPITVPGYDTLAQADAAQKYYKNELIEYQEGSQVIVQMTCIVTPEEIREWFQYKGQENNCNVSSIMICTAIPVYNENGEFVEYRNIQPKSKRHITRELLLEAEKGLEIIYQYMY